ncbi:unnamed protein product [Linum trigynum]|uniref:Uncharacterized protein n=1 Tax=Linum trigynum TaxID=586398 RepID=A0AAV2G5M4_9ROSI
MRRRRSVAFSRLSTGSELMPLMSKLMVFGRRKKVVCVLNVTRLVDAVEIDGRVVFPQVPQSLALDAGLDKGHGVEEGEKVEEKVMAI